MVPWVELLTFPQLTAVIQDAQERICQRHGPGHFHATQDIFNTDAVCFSPSSQTGVAFWVITTALRFSFNR
ncbi:hypothetical protein FNE87_03955 [Escherichia coli]|nr:hypothetical protein FNE87_03955 [Escherichia coli]